MSTTGQDVYRQLYERTPIWLASLGALTGDGGRKSSVVDGLETPELSAHVATTLQTTVSTAFDSTATERGIADASNVAVSTAITQPSSGAAPKQTYLPLFHRVEEPSPSHGPTEVFYNANAQHTLFEVVKDVGKVAYAIKKCRQRSLVEDILKKLNEASDTCEDGAFQMLREGQCRRYASSACTIFEDIFRVSCREVMHDQLAARLITKPNQPVHTPVSAKRESPSVELDDDDTIEAPLPPIRLTSRLR